MAIVQPQIVTSRDKLPGNGVGFLDSGRAGSQSERI